MEHYFEVPFYQKLTEIEGWEKLDSGREKYQVVRAMFKLVSSQMPGRSKLGRKFDVFGAPSGIGQELLKTVEIETEIFQEAKTIEKSIVDSSSLAKIVSSLSASFGEDKIFKVGGNVDVEMSESIKRSFQNDFQITNSKREKQTIKYEFKNTVSQENSDRLCGAAVYQKRRADLYLLKIDFLNVEYNRSLFGLRKKLVKHPFPKKNFKKGDAHPNIIHLGVPVAELQYWELLPKSSLVIKDSDYSQEVENDTEIEVLPPREGLKNRPYWVQDNCPSLYQLSRAAFPFKWINKPNGDLTKEALMEIEIGEAVGSGWWFQHGPGSKNTKPSRG